MNRKSRIGGICMLLMANAVFVVLYGKFLLGNAVYLYTDIGSDSVNSSLPVIVMMQRLAATGDISGFSLVNGLGASTYFYLIKYLNPLKWPLLVFRRDMIPVGIMVSLLLQTNVTAFFSWMFFRNLLRHEKAAYYAALAWTFSGYITLWSQNLTAGCCMACFTVLMASLLPLLKEPSVRRGLILSLASALFLITDYYYCYMSAYFILIFVIFFCCAGRVGLKDSFFRIACLLGAVLFAVVIASFALYPSLTNFTGSGRIGALNVLHSQLEMISSRQRFSTLARFFSVNTLGAGNSYTGTINYFEEAALSTTILAFPAVIYLISIRKTRIVTIAGVSTAVVLLLFKKAGAVIQFNSGVVRYSFMMAFAEAIAIGYFMKEMLSEPRRPHLIGASLSALMAEAGIFIFLVAEDTAYSVRTNPAPLKTAAAMSFLFTVLIVLYACRIRAVSIVPKGMALVLMAELVLMNYGTIYQRSYVTKDGFREIRESGGIRQAAEMAEDEEGENTLFRISPGSDTDDANAGMLGGFAASSVYNNTNSKSLGTFTRYMGTCQLSQNHFLANESQFGLLSFLAGKYLITDNTELSTDTPSSVFYEKIGVTEDGRKAVYLNKAALPFGYLYTKKITLEDAKELSLPDRIVAIAHAYYEIDGEEEPGDAVYYEAKEDVFQKIDLLRQGTDINQLNVKKSGSYMIFEPVGGDPYIYYNIGKSKKDSVRMLYIRLRSTNFNWIRHMQIFYMSDENEPPDPVDSRLFFLGRGYPEVLLMIPDDVVRIRLDFPEDHQPTGITELVLLESTEMGDLFEELRATNITGISMDGACYTAEVKSEGDGMLCVPMLYSDEWQAEVNGEEVRTANINGGLIGIPVGKGTSFVRLVWRLPREQYFAVVSVVAVLIWIVLFVSGKKRKK